MRIALTTENDRIFQHFGKCGLFTIFTVEDGKITEKKTVTTEGRGHGSLGNFLKEQGVNVLICGGIGGGARNMMADNNIQLIYGITGSVDQAMELYLTGQLASDETAKCDHHHGDGEHECHGHHHGDGEHQCHGNS